MMNAAQQQPRQLLGPDGRPIGRPTDRRPIPRDTSRTVSRGFVDGRGPRVQMELKYDSGGTFTEREAETAASDLTTTKWVAEVLTNHYRGHFWSVQVSSQQGLCRIGIPVLLGNWTWNIPLGLLNVAMVIKAGGELLERFNIPRSSLDVAAFVKAREKRVSRVSQKPPTG